MKGIGAQVADHFHALARHIGPRLRRGPNVVGRGLIGFGGFAFRLLWLRHTESDGLNLAFAIEIPAGAIGLARLAPDPLGLGRQLGLARFVHLDHGAALGQMIGHPLVLCAKESLHIGCVAAVLIGRREQVLDPCDAIGRGLRIIEAGVARIHARLRQRAGDVVPGDLRICFSAACISSRPHSARRSTPRR